jgi:glutamine synthetase
VPHSFVNNGYKGYLEDRRPNSQGDPYQIASQVLKTIATVPTDKKAAASDAQSNQYPCGQGADMMIRRSHLAPADHLLLNHSFVRPRFSFDSQPC